MSYLGHLIKNKHKIKEADENTVNILQSLKKKTIIEERRQKRQIKNEISNSNQPNVSLFRKIENVNDDNVVYENHNTANNSSFANKLKSRLINSANHSETNILIPKEKIKKDTVLSTKSNIDSQKTNQEIKKTITKNNAPKKEKIVKKNNNLSNTKDEKYDEYYDRNIIYSNQDHIDIRYKPPIRTSTKKTTQKARTDTREQIRFIMTSLIRKYYDQEDLIKSDINKLLHDVKLDLDLLPKTVRKPRKKKIEYTDDLFNQEEINQVLSKAEELGQKESLASTLFFKFGLKLYEIAKLKIEDVDVMKKVIKVDNKNITVDDTTFKKIVNYMAGRSKGPLLHGTGGQGFEKADLLAMIKSIMSSAKVKQRNNIESAVDNYRKTLNAQGKAYTYWDHIDKVIEIRNKEVETFKTQ